MAELLLENIGAMPNFDSPSAHMRRRDPTRLHYRWWLRRWRSWRSLTLQRSPEQRSSEYTWADMQTLRAWMQEELESKAEPQVKRPEAAAASSQKEGRSGLCGFLNREKRSSKGSPEREEQLQKDRLKTAAKANAREPAMAPPSPPRGAEPASWFGSRTQADIRSGMRARDQERLHLDHLAAYAVR